MPPSFDQSFPKAPRVVCCVIARTATAARWSRPDVDAPSRFPCHGEIASASDERLRSDGFREPPELTEIAPIEVSPAVSAKRPSHPLGGL